MANMPTTTIMLFESKEQIIPINLQSLPFSLFASTLVIKYLMFHNQQPQQILPSAVEIVGYLMVFIPSAVALLHINWLAKSRFIP